MHFAADVRNDELLAYLIRVGCPLSAVDNHGYTVMHRLVSAVEDEDSLPSTAIFRKVLARDVHQAIRLSNKVRTG